MSGAEALRVLQVSARYLPELGGTERHVAEIARRLPGLGVTAEVLTTDAGWTFPAEEVVDNVIVHRRRSWPRGSDLRIAPGLPAVIRDGGWDVVHVQGIHTLVAPMAMAAARRYKVPYLVTFHSGGHSSRLRSRIRPLQWMVQRPLLRSAYRLVAVSTFEETQFGSSLRLARRRFTVIPNGAELSASDDARDEVDSDLIVAVGRLERYKGHQRLVAALPFVRARQANARLRIVGEGPYRESLLRQAQSLGLADHVEIGPVVAGDRDGMARILSRAGVVALLSDYEAHPVAVMEALALGRPVVVADTSGLREIALRGLARAVGRDANPSEVAAALIAGLAERSRPAVELPTWDDAAARLASLYQSAAHSTFQP